MSEDKRRFRLSWFIGGGILLLVLLGLFFDVWRSYAVRASLESNVRTVAREAAEGFLPYRPREAYEAAFRGLEQRGITPDPGSVVVSPDGYSLKISVYSDVVAYFAWIVGNPRMQFQATAEAVVRIEGGGPVAEQPRSAVAFALPLTEEFKIGQNLVIMPSGVPDLPDYAIKAWRIAAPDHLKVNERLVLEPLADLKEIASRRDAIAVIVTGMEGVTAKIQGFGAVALDDVTSQGGLNIRFIRSSLKGEPGTILPAEHDFGLSQGGVQQVAIR